MYMFLAWFLKETKPIHFPVSSVGLISHKMCAYVNLGKAWEQGIHSIENIHHRHKKGLKGHKKGNDSSSPTTAFLWISPYTVKENPENLQTPDHSLADKDN